VPCGFMTSQFLSIPDAELFQMKVYEPPFWIHFPRDGGYRKDNCSDVLNCQNFERCRLMSMIDWQQSAGISQLRARTMVHAKSFLGWLRSGVVWFHFGRMPLRLWFAVVLLSPVVATLSSARRAASLTMGSNEVLGDDHVAGHRVARVKNNSWSVGDQRLVLISIHSSSSAPRSVSVVFRFVDDWSTAGALHDGSPFRGIFVHCSGSGGSHCRIMWDHADRHEGLPHHGRPQLLHTSRIRGRCCSDGPAADMRSIGLHCIIIIALR
jgi:hypothetical protein